MPTARDDRRVLREIAAEDGERRRRERRVRRGHAPEPCIVGGVYHLGKRLERPRMRRDER